MNKKSAFLVFFIALLFGAFLFLSEVAARYLLATGDQRQAGAAASWAGYKNTYVQQLLTGKDCSFVDSLTPHPYLGYVHLKNQPCAPDFVNNTGTWEKRDLPQEKDPRFFTILVLGGSVASQFASGKGIYPTWLEKELNTRYISPNGRPFRVLNGALGSWKFPAQVNMLTLNGDGVDAVIDIDGFNEAVGPANGQRVDAPDDANYLYVVRPPGLTGPLSLISFLYRFRRAAFTHSLVRNSFLAYFLFRGAVGILDRHLKQSEAAYNLLTHFFTLPKEWDVSHRVSWNKRKYERYVELLNAEAGVYHIPYAHFLQPVPFIGKDLTPEEKQSPPGIDPDVFEKIFVRGLHELQARGLPAFSLLDIYKDIKTTIYADNIHCKCAEAGCPGYAIMAERIARDLKMAWNLKDRH